MITLLLLGGASIEGPDGLPWTGPAAQPRRLALLAVLAAQGEGPISRERLVALLWPESTPDRARHLLADNLYVINRELDDDPVETAGDGLRLKSAAVRSDVARFEKALSSGEPERAVELYRGPFLDGFFLRGSVEFDDWSRGERERLERLHREALVALAESTPIAESAVEWWRRLVASDPYDARWRTGLMEALARSGNRAGALAEARSHAALLVAEFDAESDPSVEALAERIREGSFAPGDAAAADEDEVAEPSDDPAAGLDREASPGLYADASEPEEENPPGLPAPADLRHSREEAPPRIGGSPGRSWRIARLPPMTARRAGLVAATIVAVATIGFLGSRYDAGIEGWAVWPQPGTELTPEEALAAGADPGIAVLPFRVNDPALETWREGMVHLLSVNLDGVPDLRAIDSRTLLARWGEAVPDTVRPDLATLLAVARRTGARYALIGTVVAMGPDLRLSAELYEARGGTMLGSVQVVGAPDSMLVLVNRLTIEIVRALPREGNVLADVDLAEVTTNSLDALKDFLSGEALYRRTDFNGAAAAFERAIASDSTFALAWARLGDTCNWVHAVSELCGRNPPGWREEHLNRLPLRRADFARALVGLGARERIEALWQLVRRYPDDPYLWYQLGDTYWHYGDWALADPAEGVAAFERAIALAPTTSAEPYVHLIQHAFAEADSAQVVRLLNAYGRITHAAGQWDGAYRLAFALGFGDPGTRAQTHAALDTIPTLTLTVAILTLRHPRQHEASREALRVLLARPDHRLLALFAILHRRGKVRAELDVVNDPVIRPAYRAALIYRLHEVGVKFEPEELERILVTGAADTTPGNIVRTRTVPGPAVALSNLLWVGTYAVDRGDWEQYEATRDRQRARARSYLARGDSLNARRQQAEARALEGYALWKRGQKTQAIHALETAQRQVYGWSNNVAFVPNFTVREWLGELMLEVGRPRDAERYFKSLAGDPFAALRLGKVYEELGEFDAARAAYQYALLSWQDADPELQPRIQEGRQALAGLPEPIRRE